MGPEILLLCSQIPPFVRVLRQINPVHTLPDYLFKIHLTIMLPLTYRSSKWTLPQISPPKLPMHPYPANFVLRHSINWLIFCDECNSWTSVGMLCSFFESSRTSFLFYITPFSKTLSLCFFLSVVDQVSHPYKVPGTVWYWTLNILYIWLSQ